MIFADKTELPSYLILLILLASFGLILIIIIFVNKKFVKPIQKKEEISEEQASKEELDRVLVPIEDEEIQKQMEENMKNDGK